MRLKLTDEAAKVLGKHGEQLFDPYGMGIGSDVIYHIKGTDLQQMLWVMNRLHNATLAKDDERIELLVKSVREHIDRLVNKGIR